MIYRLEQTNLPQDITVQFTGMRLLLVERRERSISFVELYIKNRGYVHAALELVEVCSFIHR